MKHFTNPSDTKSGAYLPLLVLPGVSVKFYMVAISFIVFDLETIFLLPWAVHMRELGWSAFLSMTMFVAVLAIGLVYEWKKGGFEWE